jgi:hypothetical protein
MIKTRRVITMAALAAAGLAASAGPAAAQVAGGNDAAVSVSLPVVVCGNGVGLLGTAIASCPTPTATGPTVAVDPTAVTGGGVASGNTALVGVDAPVVVCGNAVGSASAACSGGVAGGGAATPAEPGSSSGSGAGSGNDVIADVRAPITVCGNAVGVLGDPSSAACSPDSAAAGTQPGSGVGSAGVLAGTDVLVGVDVPVTACGNAVGVLGSSDATCAARLADQAPATTPTGTTPTGTTPTGSTPADQSGTALPNASSQATSAVGRPAGLLASTGAVVGVAALLALGAALIASGGVTNLVARLRPGS